MSYLDELPIAKKVVQNATKIYVLADYSWMCYRAYYAHKELKTKLKLSSGEQDFFTAVQFGLTRFVRSIYQSKPLIQVIFCVDSKPEERLAIQEDYKAGRKSKQEEFHHKLNEELLSYHPLVTFAKAEGKEADDVMAQLFFDIKAREPHADVIIYSGDNDMLQLMQYGAKISRKMERGWLTFLDEAFIRQSYQCPMEDLLIVRSIKGDTSDNLSNAVPRLNTQFLLKFAAEVSKQGSLDRAIRYLPIANDKEKEYLDRVKEALPLIKKNLRMSSLVKYRHEAQRFQPEFYRTENPIPGLCDVLDIQTWKNFIQTYKVRTTLEVEYSQKSSKRVLELLEL